MNAARRKQLDRALALLGQAKEIVSDVASEEQDAFDNLPEGIQDADKGQNMQQAADDLFLVESSFEELAEGIQAAQEQ